MKRSRSRTSLAEKRLSPLTEDKLSSAEQVSGERVMKNWISGQIHRLDYLDHQIKIFSSHDRFDKTQCFVNFMYIQAVFSVKSLSFVFFEG